MSNETDNLLEDPKNLERFDDDLLYLFARQCAHEAYQKILVPLGKMRYTKLYLETGDSGARIAALEELGSEFRRRSDKEMKRDSAESCARDACHYATERRPGVSPALAAWYAADGLAAGLSRLLEVDPIAERAGRLAVKARLAQQLESLE